MPERLFFVTSREEKAQETREILAVPFQVITTELVEIQSMDLEEIARYKAIAAFSFVHKSFSGNIGVFVDDVGLYIDDLYGFPGPFFKYLTDDNNERLLNIMHGRPNRGASLQAAIGYYDGRCSQTFLGEVRGTISEKPRGKNGWGLDPIFIPHLCPNGHTPKKYPFS
jgi:XTP/dITP diphosphohydrolase